MVRQKLPISLIRPFVKIYAKNNSQQQAIKFISSNMKSKCKLVTVNKILKCFNYERFNGVCFLWRMFCLSRNDFKFFKIE